MLPVLHINLTAIQNNYKYMQSICNAEVAASVKANCYGLGTEYIAPALYNVGCRKFFVATIEEAIELRLLLEPDSQIFLLQGIFPSEIRQVIAYNIVPVINTLKQLSLWMQHYPKKACAIHIDTGMNRLGINVEDFVQIKTLPQNTQFLMSHLACDGDKSNNYNPCQLEKFISATSLHPHIKKSLAASGGVFLGPEYHFDIVRVGAALYGLGARKHTQLQNPVALMAPIIQIRKCTKDEYVGYGLTTLVPKGTVLATIPVGYADGFSRFLSNKSSVYIKGKEAKIIGRISMDLTVVDVTDHQIFEEENVEIIGPNIYPDDIGSKIDTIGYEILTSLHKGRFYVSVYK